MQLKLAIEYLLLTILLTNATSRVVASLLCDGVAVWLRHAALAFMTRVIGTRVLLTRTSVDQVTVKGWSSKVAKSSIGDLL